MVACKKEKNVLLSMQQNENYIIQTENLSIGYQSKSKPMVVADNICIRLKKGELNAVIGVNGSGKSTLIKSISKIIPAIEGSIHINNLPIQNINERDLANQISLVLTKQPVSKQLKVSELIALGRHPYTNWIGLLSQEDKRMVNKAIQQVGIADLKNKRCDELSDGQFQKVLIARALAQDTPVIILDEPTTHLDMYHKAQVLHLLKKIASETEKCVLYASHEINLAIKMCHQIMLIHQGKVIQGAPSKLIEEKSFEQLFPDNLIYFDEASQSFSIKL